jgi:hypothetical protein
VCTTTIHVVLVDSSGDDDGWEEIYTVLNGDEDDDEMEEIGGGRICGCDQIFDSASKYDDVGNHICRCWVDWSLFLEWQQKKGERW